MKYFTGVGSRETDEEGCELLFSASKYLASQEYILRSGGAEGADVACEKGCDLVQGVKEIYIPWKGFNKSNSILIGSCNKAQDMASKLHPAWEKCSKWARILHGRNCYQVLGKTLDKPSDLLICWTPNGEVRGGTATAIKLAISNNIPIYNFGRYDDIIKFEKDFNIKISQDKQEMTTGYKF